MTSLGHGATLAISRSPLYVKEIVTKPAGKSMAALYENRSEKSLPLDTEEVTELIAA